MYDLFTNFYKSVPRPQARSFLADCRRLPVEEVANHANLDHGMFVQFCDAATMCLLCEAQPIIDESAIVP